MNAKPAPVEPAITPHPTTEDGVLQAFTQALEETVEFTQLDGKLLLAEP